MEIVTLILVVVLAGLVGVFLFKKQGEQPAGNDQSAALMQQQIESLRGEVSQSLKTATDTMFQSMRATSENLNQQVALVTQSIQKTTEQVNQQLSAQTSTIGTRLDTAGESDRRSAKEPGTITAGDGRNEATRRERSPA